MKDKEVERINYLIKSESLEDLNKRIKECTNDYYSIEECFEDILSFYFYNKKVFKPFVIDSILTFPKSLSSICTSTGIFSLYCKDFFVFIK